tara:strand:+ start:114 stop:557 length:444 start_codon:yes stop_codon:yes gene_type:complete
MSDIVKDIFTTTDKVNFLSNTNNITKLVSNFENFSSNKDETLEEKRERLCKMVITIRVLYILTIFVALYIANSNGVISTELFMGLSLLALAMPDIVLIVLILISIVGSGRNSSATQSPPRYTESATSSEFRVGELKYALTQTPDVFN